MGALAAPESGHSRIVELLQQVIEGLFRRFTVSRSLQQDTGVQELSGQAQIVFQHLFVLRLGPISLCAVPEETAVGAVVHLPIRHAVEGLD